MKKLLAIILAALMCASLAACGEGATPQSDATNAEAYGIMQAAQQLMETAGSYSMDMDMVMNMEVAGQKVDVTVDGDMNMVTSSPTEIEFLMNMKTAAAGQEMTVVIYFKDGFAYMDTSGQKMKIAMDLETAMKSASQYQVKFDESAIKTSSIKETADGKELNFEISGDALQSMLGDSISSIQSMAGGDAQITSDKLTYKMLVDKDGAPKSITVYADMSFSMAGETVKATIDMELEVTAIGGVAIEAPADLGSYVETTV